MRYLLVVLLICWAVAFVLAAYGSWRRAEITSPDEPHKDQDARSKQRSGTAMVKTATIIFLLGGLAGIIYWFTS
jgi:hypothetical protein